MRQCQNCRRFLGSGATECRYCSSSNHQPLTFSPSDFNQLDNFKIFPDTISINGAEYKIGKPIGQGGHGIVLEVISPDQTTLALKVPLRFNEHFTNNQGNRKTTLELSEKYISHEIRMLRQIVSPALIQICFTGNVSCEYRGKSCQFPAILMEMGQCSLKDIIDMEMESQLEVPYEEKKEMIRQLSSNIEKLHEKNIVHRDLSPHNIFLVDRNGRIQYVLADFGTSKPAIQFQDRSSTTRMAFHDRYVDPTLFVHNNYRYNFRLDLYQLGIIFTEIWMGEYWITSDADTSISDLRTVDFENEFLVKFASNEIPQPLIETIRKATTLKLNRRYPSTKEFREAFTSVLAHEALSGIPPKPRNCFKRNIAVSFRHIVGDSDTPPVKDTALDITYRRQNRIDMSTSRRISLHFPHLQIDEARILGTTILSCTRKDNTLELTVDTGRLDRIIDPVVRPSLFQAVGNFFKRIFNFRKIHQQEVCMELDFKSILYLKATPLKEAAL